MSSPGKCTVLLVEDNEPFRRAVVDALEQSDFRVICCASTSEALDLLDASQTFEVLISRVRVPQGQPHGLSLACITRARPPRTMVILHTSCDDLPENEIRSACTCFVRQPVDAPDLAAIVERQWRSQPGADLGESN